MAYSQTFIVTGKGEFPFDMLRYDHCYPASESSSAEMGGTELRSVWLRRRVDNKTSMPTAARWRSFQWLVSEVNTVKI